MDGQEIQKQLERLSLHPVNLAVASVDGDHVALRGSLLAHWPVPSVVDGNWLHQVLTSLPDAAGPSATMEAFSAAHAQRVTNTE
jgi:hypothetical protein